MSSRDRRSSPRGSRPRRRSSPRGGRGSSPKRYRERPSSRDGRGSSSTESRTRRRPSPRDGRGTSPVNNRHTSGNYRQSSGRSRRTPKGGRTPPRNDDLTQSEGSDRRDEETLPDKRVRLPEKTWDNVREESPTSWTVGLWRKVSELGRRSSCPYKRRDRDREQDRNRDRDRCRDQDWDREKEFYFDECKEEVKEVEYYDYRDDRRESNERYREKRSRLRDRSRRVNDSGRRTPTPPRRSSGRYRPSLSPQPSPRRDKLYDAPLNADLDDAFEKLRNHPSDRHRDRDISRSGRRLDREYSNSRSHRTESGVNQRGDTEYLEISLSKSNRSNATTHSQQTFFSISDESESRESTSTFRTEDSYPMKVNLTKAHFKQEPPRHKLVRPELEPRPTELRRNEFKSAKDYLDIRNNKILISLFDSNSRSSDKERVVFSDEGHTINYSTRKILYSKDRAIILTNKSLYLFPPLVWVESKSYIIANDYKRYCITDIARVSMPYRTKVDRETREELAVRTNEAAVHMLCGHTIWVSMGNAKRQEFVETLNDVYQNRLGSPVLMSQDDYRELLNSITKASLWQSLARMSIRAWATGAQILKSGKLLYQERNMRNRRIVSKVWRKKWVCLFVHALVILDSHEDLEFLRRGHFTSNSWKDDEFGKFQLFRLRGCLIKRNTKKQAEWRVIENPKKNVLVASRRCGEFKADSSQDSKTWVEAINSRKDLSIRLCVNS